MADLRPYLENIHHNPLFANLLVNLVVNPSSIESIEFVSVTRFRVRTISGQLYVVNAPDPGFTRVQRAFTNAVL